MKQETKKSIAKVLFSNGKKTASHLLFSATLLVLQVPGHGRHSHRFKRNLFTPPVNIEKQIFSYCTKALKSSWKQRPRQIPCFEHASQSSANRHTHIHPLRNVDRFLVWQIKTFKLTSSILCQFCVCVAHSTSLIADLFKVLRNRWKHYFNFPSLIYHDEVFKSRSGFEIAICLISAKCLLWSQALIEKYLKNVHRHFRLIIFRDHRCKHF